METKQKTPNIELRSEEVQELMGKIPPAILRVGISVILFFVVLIFIVSNFVKYPDIITIPIVAKNVNCMAEIKAVKSGQLVESHMEHSRVCMGDTLAKIAINSGDVTDTLCVKSPFTGYVYPCSTFQEKDYVDENDVLCVVVDSIKDLIIAKASISSDMKKKIVSSKNIESNIGDILLQGKVASIADYSNPTNGTYIIVMEFEKSKELENMIIWNCHTFAKIKISERSVFDKFFKDRVVSNVFEVIK